jgi:hypothetical protein
LDASNLCAWCKHPKTGGIICSNCGADYAKAAAIRQHGKVQAVAPDPSAPSVAEVGFTVQVDDSSDGIEDPKLEKQLRLLALPSMLVAGFLVQATGFGAGMQRIVFGMPVHELGHATVAWLCGFNAIPTFWKTVSSGQRGMIASVLVLFGLLALANYGRKKMQVGWIVLAAFLLVMQGIGTFMLSSRDAEMYIVFGGDAGGMVLATGLMLSFYFGSETQNYKGGLRWGFIGIGAAAFADMFMTWWRAADDRLAVPYGLSGGEPTDAFKLINYHTWSWEQLISRHVNVGIACLIVLLVFYVWGVKQANRMVEAKALAERAAALSLGSPSSQEIGERGLG